MCRNAVHSYKGTYICVQHRHVAQFHYGAEPRCPVDSEPLVFVGVDFKAPRKRDDKGWKAVETHLSRGGNYITCGCSHGRVIPRTPAEFRQADFIRRWRVRGRKSDYRL